MTIRDYYRAAQERVATDAELAQYRDILLDYDWHNMNEHLQWVAEGDREEILDWCRTVREGEQ